MILPKPNIFILDSGMRTGVLATSSQTFLRYLAFNMNGLVLFQRVESPKVKKIVTSLPAALAPFAIIIAATALSNSPLNSTIVVPLDV